jgi:prepilin-type N-terminal cleavage/methylation domain-containing protein
MNQRSKTNDPAAGLRSLTGRPLGPARRGFTLVEMLIVIAIIAILAAAMAYAVGGAQESARVAKTRAIIAKLHTLVMQKYESYYNRRLPITIPPTVYDPATKAVIPTPPRAIAKVRCDALRALMKMEMPERWTDVRDDPKNSPIPIVSPGNPASDPSKWSPYGDINDPSQPATVTITRPSINQAYYAFFNSLGAQNVASMESDANQGAKCLYLLVTMGLDEPDALKNFSTSDIGDPDHSGCKVFLDAWGPIRFLRWAPGYSSPLQPQWTTASQHDARMPDQSDPAGIYFAPKPGSIGPGGPGRIRGNTFALYPLIYSAGPDGHYDILSSMVAASGPFRYAQTKAANNPFESVSNVGQFQAGAFGASVIDPPDRATRTALGNADNITNHDIEARSISVGSRQ